MAPKTEKLKASQEEKPALSDPVNTDDWKCAVALLLERSPCDVILTRMFSQEAAMEARKEVKSLDFERDIMKILKEYVTGETSNRFAYLLNFSEVFDEATRHLKAKDEIPIKLMVQIIKAFILMLRKEDMERRTKVVECNNDPIEIMAAKPFVSVLAEKGSEKRRESKANNEKKKQAEKKTPDVRTSRGAVRARPPELTKEDTRLLKRGQQAKDFHTIDDAPQGAFFKLYIVLTGFREPGLALEMVKSGIPLHGVFCVTSSNTTRYTPISKPDRNDLDKYWTQFLQLLWCPEFTHYFSDVVFQLYAPAEIPSPEAELRSFMYREISFLMYDLSELKQQLTWYNRSMRLWNVDAQVEDTKPDPNYRQELEQLPQDCVNIPIIVQHILDLICGEDHPQDEEEEDVPSQVKSPSASYSSSSFSESPVLDYQSKVSFTSLIPFSSTVRLPTPQWSDIVDTDEKHILYNKLLTLDREYGLEEDFDGGGPDLSTYNVSVCALKKQRLPCENLDMEIQNYQGGLLSKFWINYPKRQGQDFSNKLLQRIKVPEFMANYLLYILWVLRVDDNVSQENEVKSITNVSTEQSRTKFTITDGSRIALHKAFRSKDFFSPSELKVITPETLISISEPQLTPPPKFSWAEKSFVSDSHIPVKYLTGNPLGVFDDLRNFVGEEVFSHMKDYDFIEELSKRDMIQKIEESFPNYDCIRHAYSPLTDSLYVCMYNIPYASGVKREFYNVMLRTPVGLRDFHDYVLDDEQEWMHQQKQESPAPWSNCPISMYNPTPCFLGFTEYDFWHENSIKYMTRAKEFLGSVIQKIDSGETEKSKKEEESKQQAPGTVYAQVGEPYNFVGFDFEPGAIQYSGMETIFKGPDGCYVRVCLQERLYGKQQLGLHIQQGGHILHLYSFICPQAHINQPHTFHVEFKNGILIAFSRRVSPKKINIERQTTEDFTTTEEVDDNFDYDMKLSFPHDLTVEIIREHVNPSYIKQSYISKNNPATIEKKRLFLPNGSVVKIMTNDTVEVLNADTSIVVTSLKHLVLRPVKSENEDALSQGNNLSHWLFQSYTETMKNGCQYRVIDEEVVETKRFQIIKNTVMEAKEKYFHRMDSTKYVMLSDGTVCVEFPDGTKISTSLLEDNLCLEDDVWYGEEVAEDMYIIVHVKIVMEHPMYATVTYDSRSSTWRILLPSKSEIETDPSGCHHVHLDGQTELDINKKTIRMWRYSPKDEFIMSINADLTSFEKEQPGEYCTAIDSRGRRFVVECDGNCYVTGNDDRSSGSENQADDELEPRKYFVVRRDLTGFEIVHTQTVTKEIEAVGPEVLTLCQELTLTPVTRYFALLKKANVSHGKWTVDSITPDTKFRARKLKTSSAYGNPPSWMHPFPKKHPKEKAPESIEGRVLLETKPTACPFPTSSTSDYAFCDTSHFPDPSISLTENVPALMRKVADQDQDILKQIFFAAVRQRARSKHIIRPSGPKLENYLNMSKHHVKVREYLKDCIRKKAITGYFDHPRGMAWLIIQSIIKNFAEDMGAPAVEAPPVTERTESSKEPSEIEYNIDFSSDPSYSDLSFRSNVSTKTAPPTVKNVPICSTLLPTPRDTKSEPIYKIEDVKKQDDSSSYTYEYNFSPPSSEICAFTAGDLDVLEQASPSKDKESEISTYQLGDLIKLGLI